MLGRTVHSKKTSKFEDSDSSHMSRPRAVSELPRRAGHRVAPPRLRTAAAAVGSEASSARHRATVLGVGRTTSPRSPLHEKKPSGAGAGPRVAVLEAKLGKADDQLAEMREQLAAAEKARKDARASFAEAKQRFAEKKRDVPAATSAPVEDEDDDVPGQQKHQAEVVTTDDVTNGGDEERGISVLSMPAMPDVPEPTVPENKAAQVEDANKATGDVGEMNDTAIVADDDGGEEGNPEADQLRTKLVATDTEVYELRAKLMVKDMEVDELRVKLAAKDADVDELTAKLVAKDAEIVTLRADNADLMVIYEEASEAVKETAGKARGIEHALRESAAREARLAERLRASERAREALEAEAQRSRVQSEQWRKAAEEAAAVLGGADRHVVGARRGAEMGMDRRCHSSGCSGGGAGGRVDKPSADDEGSSGKRKSGATGVAMRVLSDLWKKKGQK